MFTRRWHQAKEPRLAVSANLFSYHPEIGPAMRCKLVNWLIEVRQHVRPATSRV